MRALYLAVLLLLSSTNVLSEPKVLFDSGRTINANKYLSSDQKALSTKPKPSITSLVTPDLLPTF